MRVIIAGSRTITDPLELEKAIKLSGFQIDSILCGGSYGVDKLGFLWADAHNIPVTLYVPDWEKYGKSAGPIRNSEMAKLAEALILVWDGVSKGSKDMLNKANSKGLKVYVHLVKKEEEKDEM
jgi:hypothetical protein